MKNTKWIWRILAVLLSLAVLVGVAFAGFRIGSMQSANLTDGIPFHRQAFDKSQGFDGDFQRGQGFDPRGFDHGRNFGGRMGFRFFSPLFGLLHLALWGGLIWLGYTLIKNSGWRLVKVNANQAAATPAVEETPSARDEEKKDEA